MNLQLWQLSCSVYCMKNNTLSGLPAALAAEVRAELAARKLNALGLVDILGVAPVTARSRFDGSTLFTLPEMSALADSFGMTLSDLLSRAEARSVQPGLAVAA